MPKFEHVLNKENNKLVHLKDANKKDSYKCPECDGDMVFCKGKVMIPYFRHVNKKQGEKCEKSISKETIEHIKAKYTIQEYLKNNLLNVERKCSTHSCTNIVNFSIPKPKYIKIEAREIYNNKNISYDIGLYDESGKFYFGIEIMHSHKTKEQNRPNNLWIELKCCYIDNYIKNNLFTCNRNVICNACNFMKNLKENYLDKYIEVSLTGFSKTNELPEDLISDLSTDDISYIDNKHSIMHSVHTTIDKCIISNIIKHFDSDISKNKYKIFKLDEEVYSILLYSIRLLNSSQYTYYSIDSPEFTKFIKKNSKKIHEKKEEYKESYILYDNKTSILDFTLKLLNDPNQNIIYNNCWRTSNNINNRKSIINIYRTQMHKELMKKEEEILKKIKKEKEKVKKSKKSKKNKKSKKKIEFPVFEQHKRLQKLNGKI